VKFKSIAPLFVAVSLGGCATAIEGTSQDIAVVTIPAGAVCVLNRDGKQIGAIAATPGTSHIEKSKYDITITCKKDGYEDAVVVDESGTAAASAGSFVADVVLTEGLLGAVDSVSGADNKYDSTMTITMVAKGAH
jgi:hypothetical protein